MENAGQPGHVKYAAFFRYSALLSHQKAGLIDIIDYAVNLHKSDCTIQRSLKSRGPKPVPAGVPELHRDCKLHLARTTYCTEIKRNVLRVK